MLRIGYITNTNVQDKTIWSGTIFNLYNILSKKYVVDSIVLATPWIDKFYYIRRGIRKLLFKKSSTDMMVSYAKIKSKSLNKVLKASSEKYDILFFPGNSIATAYIKTTLPIVYLSDATFHAMINYYYFGLDKKSIKNGNVVEERALFNCNQIVYSSKWAKKDAIDFYGVNADKISVLPFGANLIDRYIKNNYDLNREINLLLVGVDWKRKGVDIALECIEYLNRLSDLKYKLTVIGLEKPENLNIDNVSFIGFLNKNNQNDYDRLIKYYQESDIFILPTRAECSAIVFSEASMYGLPIITYDTGGIQTYVKNGVNGFRLPLDKRGKDFAEKIEYICKNNEIYKNFSLNARREFEKSLNWDKWLESFDGVLKKCLNRD